MRVFFEEKQVSFYSILYPLKNSLIKHGFICYDPKNTILVGTLYTYAVHTHTLGFHVL